MKEKALDLSSCLIWRKSQIHGKGEVQAKPTLSHLKDCREETGKTNRSGHNVLFLPHWGPETPTGALASEISRYIWKNQEYWAVGTHPWGQQKKVITQGKDKFAVILIIEFWLSGIQSLDPRNGEEQNNG